MIKYNRFRDISDINQLEAIEDELLLQVDDSSNEAAKRKLIHLYLRMWELQPESDRYELSLSKLYLGLGWDLKKQRVNYEEAIKFFKKVIELKRPMIVPIAHYRLAFIVTANPYWPEYDSVRCQRFARNRVLSEEIRGKVSTDDFPSACR